MLFRQIFDDKLAQYAYLIGCQRTGDAVVIDPERDIDRYLRLAQAEGLNIVAVAETHIHADFLSGAREFAAHDPNIRVYLSDEGTREWKSEWVKNSDIRATLLRNGDRFQIGGIEIQALHTPGHTPEHLAYLVTDRGGGADTPMGLISGDFVFVGDLGRPDLLESAAKVEGVMEPSARQLHASTQVFFELEDHLQVWPAHGAGSACGKSLGAVPQTTVGYERRYGEALNIARRSEDEFVDFILSNQPDPPLYFARMKQLNRDGVPVLGELPIPDKIEAEELALLGGRADVTIVDTRGDAKAFAAGHLPGSIHAPLTRAFPTTVGSLADPLLPLVLIVEDQRVEEAVRDLVRIGFDVVVSYASPETLDELVFLQRSEVIDFNELDQLRQRDPVQVVDVRTSAEFARGHIENALNLPHTRIAERLDELPRDVPLAVHCASGARAAAATSLLLQHGYDVRAVVDDFETWMLNQHERTAR